MTILYFCEISATKKMCITNNLNVKTKLDYGRALLWPFLNSWIWKYQCKEAYMYLYVGLLGPTRFLVVVNSSSLGFQKFLLH